MPSAKPQIPSHGSKITQENGKLKVPDHPILPFIEGDGTGRDIWRASVGVFDAAVMKAYGGKRRIAWTEVYAGEKAFKQFGNWLPDETVEAFRDYLVGIKGPLTTPVGGGIRSLNVALRQLLDLYVCLRPVRWFKGVPSPVKRPDKVDMVIFRENTEDIYAGIEWEAESRGREEGARVPGAGVPQGVQEDAVPRIVRRRPEARLARGDRAARPGGARLRHPKPSQERDAGPQGQHHEVHRGRLPDWGYAVAEREYADRVYTWSQWEKTKAEKGEEAANAEQRQAQAQGRVLVKDAIADITLQQVLTRPDEFDVIATLNLNGDYLSDALAAQVGGIGIAPGGNINYLTGHAIFEATHGTAPKYADLDKVNPGIGDPLRRDDAAPHGLERGRRSHHQGDGRRHRRPSRDLRLRPPDEGRGGGRRRRGEVLGVRDRDHEAHAVKRAP